MFAGTPDDQSNICMPRTEFHSADGKFIESICGSVRGKTASGGETGDRPFLYLVQEEDAYVGGYFMATSPHHNICNYSPRCIILSAIGLKRTKSNFGSELIVRCRGIKMRAGLAI